MASPPEPEEFWLFGYGSLIWKPPPHFDRRIPGYVTGYVRRFWQASPNALLMFQSEDHRGTPAAPGRVVTLITRTFWSTLHDPHPAPERVWGCAYRIAAPYVDEVKTYLDIREINGYTIHYTPFHPSVSLDASISSQISERSEDKRPGENTIKCMVYIGTPDNPQFTGVQDVQKLAEHIWVSQGPSGLNREYLLGLDEALRELGPESGDIHVEDLARRLGEIKKREKKKVEHGEGENGVVKVRDIVDEKSGHKEGLEEELEEVEG